MSWLHDSYGTQVSPAPEEEDEQLPPALPSPSSGAGSNWLIDSYSAPAELSPQPKKKRRRPASFGAALRQQFDEDVDAAKAIGKGLMRGTTSAVDTIAVQAPNFLLHGSEELLRQTGMLSPEMEERFNAGQRNVEEGWNKPLREVLSTSERYWAPDAREQAGFFDQLKDNPARALSVGLAENVPQYAAQLGATALNPLVGVAFAGASEGGGAWKEAKASGATDEEAAQAAGLTAIPNMVLEYLPGAGLLKKAFGKVPAQEVQGVLREVVKEALKEGGTEGLQELNSVLASLATYAGDKGMSWNDVRSAFSPENLERYGASAILGAMMGGGAGAVTQGISASHQTAPAFDPGPSAPPHGEPDRPRTSQSGPPPPPPESGGRVVPFPTPVREAAAPPPAALTQRQVAPDPAIQGERIEPPIALDEEPSAPRSDDSSPERQPEPSNPPSLHPEAVDGLASPVSPPPMVRGRTGTTFTERGRPVEFDYALIEAAEARTSHNDALDVEPGYPQQLQPRDRDRAASAAQVSRIESSLNPALVGENPKASDGAPVLGPDGLVEGGNARTIGIRRAYRSGNPKAEEYRQWLRSNAPQFGLEPEAVDSLSQPLLVRVRRNDVGDRAEFARELNESGVAAMSATERAKADAARISSEMLGSLKIPESGEVNWLANRSFVEGFVSRLSPAEHGALYDKRGGLSVEGQQRLRNAVLARAFEDPEAVAKLIESSDNNVRTIGAAMMREAPRFAAMRAGMERGALHPRDLGPDIAAALGKLSALRAEGTRVPDYLSQAEMFGPELSTEARELLGVFDKHARSGRAIGDVLRSYAEMVESLGHPQQESLFGAVEPPSKLELVKTAIAEAEFHRQRDLFGGGAEAGAAGRAYVESHPHVGAHDPEATKLWRKIALDAHPDRSTDEADRARRTKFLVEANNAYETDDLARLRQIVEAWEAGRDINVRPTGRHGPRRNPPPAGSPPPPRPPRNPPPPPRGGTTDTPPPSPPEGEPRRSVDTETVKLRLELPEIVEFLQELGGGRLPKVRQVLNAARGRALGIFHVRGGNPDSAGVEVRADIAENPELAARVLAHEAGHWVDSIPQASLKRGNILGSLASLKSYLKTMLDELPTDSSRVFTDKERAAWRRDAVRQARQELGKGSSGVAARAAKLYRETLVREMEDRRLVDRGTVMDELRRVSAEWRGPFSNGDPYRDHPRELYADAFSALLNEPSLVKEEAPTFHSLFFNYLSRKPEVKAVYEEIQLRIEQGPEAVLDSRARRYLEMVREGATARAEQLSRFPRSGITLFQGLVDGLLDRKSKLYRDVAKARRAGAALNPDKNPVYWVEEASYHSAQSAWYLDRMAADVLDVTRAAGVTDTEFGAVLGLTRAAGERAGMFNPLGMQGRFAEQLREHLLAKLGEDKARACETAARAWWALRKEVLAQIERSGAFRPSFLRKAKANPEYVKFFVASYMKSDEVGRATGSIHRQIGTLAKIGNPVVETALTDLALMRVAHRTQTARSIVDFYRSNFPEEIQAAKRGRGGQFLETRTPGKSTLFFLEGGEVKAYYASERVVSFMEADTARAGAAYRAYNLLTRPLRALFVDRNPWWAFWNLYRDAKAFAKQVVTAAPRSAPLGRRVAGALGSPVTASLETMRYLLKALPDASLEVFFGRRTETVREMLKGRMLVESGSSVSSSLAGDDNEVMDQILKRFGVIDATHHRAAVRLLERLWDWAGRPGQLTERLVKVAGYKYLKDNRTRLNLSDREIGHRVRTLAGTPDVMRRGEWFKVTNSLFLFSNVGKEGLRSAAEAAKLSPGEYAMKTMAFDVVPKLVMIAIAAGWAGEEWEKWFAKLSEYDKSNFIIIPLGTTPSGKAVFTRIPHDHVGQIVGGLLWRSFSDERSMADLFDWMDQNLPYSPASLHPYITAGWATKDYLQGKNPMDTYTGHPMVPERTFTAGGGRSHKAFLKALWGELGLDVLVRFGTEEPSEIASGLEEALGMPILGPALARFVKVSDYGTTERLRRISDEVKTEDARRSLDLEEIIRQGLQEDPDATAAALYRAAQAADLDAGRFSDFKRRFERIKARLSDDPFERALSYTQSKRAAERIEDEREE